MKILVTGGAGYVGSVLVPQLVTAGHDVTVLDNMSYEQAGLIGLRSLYQFNLVNGDVRNLNLVKELLEDVEIVIPLAAVVGAPACDKDPEMAQAVNYDAIESMLKLMKPEQKIIFPTTNSGYGTKSGDVYCTEETPLEPISLYGRLKCEAEKLILKRGNAITLRFATVFGVSPRLRLDLLVNSFVYEALQRKYILLYEKDFRRNYLHIRDAADCIIHCINSFDSMKNEIYNVGLDEANLSKWQLANLVKEHVPEFEIVCSEIGTDPDKRDYIVSNEKLRQSGFVASRPIEKGVEELLSVYKMMSSWRSMSNV